MDLATTMSIIETIKERISRLKEQLEKETNISQQIELSIQVSASQDILMEVQQMLIEDLKAE